MFVAEGIDGLFLSWYTSRNLGFLPHDYPRQQSSRSRIEATSDNESTSDMIDIVTVEDNRNTCDNKKIVEKDNNPENQNITADDSIREFPLVFSEEVKGMKGEEFKICLEDKAVPFRLTAPRTIPYAYTEKLKTQLDKMVADKIIKPITTPTQWCAPIVVASKKGTDKVRICVDVLKLNKYVKHER